MSETQQTTATELEALKQRATVLGIKFPKNISETRLRELITAELEQNQEEVSEEDARRQRLAAARKEQKALVRVIISPMNPAKAQLTCEMFSFSNDVFSEKRVIQFGKPWHVPKGMLDDIQSRVYQAFRDIKTPRGVVQESYFAPAYGVQILPPISQEELEEIKKKQMAEGL